MASAIMAHGNWIDSHRLSAIDCQTRMRELSSVSDQHNRNHRSKLLRSIMVGDAMIYLSADHFNQIERLQLSL